MKRKISDIILIALLVFCLVAGLFRAVLFQRDINYYENRPANKMPALTLQTYFDGSFQSGVENAFCDQLPLAQSFKKAYNDANSYFLKFVTEPFKNSTQNKYMELMGMKLYDGEYFCNVSFNLEKYKDNFDKRLQNINSVVAAHPEVEFYGYYVEKDVDINFETGERFGGYDYVKQNIAIKQDNFRKFSVDSFETYKKYFYKTDHHWNLDGSYKGYTEVLNLVLPNATPLVPSSKRLLTSEFSGGYAKGKGIAGYVEDFYVYDFDYSPKEIWFGGAKQQNYGGDETNANYGSWYGADISEIVFKNDLPKKENILVIGDSYDNAILKLLSAHFNKLCSIDLRYNKDFELSSYLKNHKIDKVLIIGSSNVFFAQDFNLEDKTL